MARGDKYRLLRGQVSQRELFEAPRGGAPPAPPRKIDVKKHSAKLLGQLDAVQKEAARRAEARDEDASRQVVAVRPGANQTIDPKPLSDKRTDIRVVAKDPDTGVVVLDARDADLAALRKKAEELAKKTRGKENKPAHLAGLAPVDAFALAEPDDLLGPRLRHERARLKAGSKRWFELGCRGGTHAETAENKNTYSQMRRQLHALRVEHVEELELPEKIVFYAKMSLDQITRLMTTVDCVFEIDLAPTELHGWLALDHDDHDGARQMAVAPPTAQAPTVAVLDTGIASEHPLLKPAIRGMGSVVPEDASPADVYGHGTKMAGLALFEDVATVVDNGSVQAEHWLQSVKLLRQPHVGSAAKDQTGTWPVLTRNAVAEAEKVPASSRVFAMATTADLPVASGKPAPGTGWSDELDQLCFNNGRGRLVVISSGNADVHDINLLNGYPQLNLGHKLGDPAQAANALTIGAFTAKTQLPPNGGWKGILAPDGGLSPHSRTGPVNAGPVKPEVVFEGGNISFDDTNLPDATVPTLVQSTTGLWPRHVTHLHNGTSAATANAARFAAQLLGREPGLRPETVRGLMVHSARWTPAMKEQFSNVDERLAAVGYGVPDLDIATACLDSRATVVVESTLPNAVREEVPKRTAPKRPTTKATVTKPRREVAYFRLPVPLSLVEAGDSKVDVRVTLSYFGEPSTIRGQTSYGMHLSWDMQGPDESEEAFHRRINKRERDGETKDWSGSFSWGVGIQRRSRGTVQTDFCTVPAPDIAGGKLLAVYPRTGWWWRRTDEALLYAEVPFTLIVTLDAPDLAITQPIASALRVPVEIAT